MNPIGRFIQDRLSQGVPSLEQWDACQEVDDHCNQGIWHLDFPEKNPAIQVLIQLFAAETGAKFRESDDACDFLLDMGFAKKRFALKESCGFRYLIFIDSNN